MDTERTDSELGKLGEKWLNLWATQGRMIANKSGEDEGGWDYLLELPRAHTETSGLSLDLVPGQQKCFVQVKALSSADNRAKIALSNWQRMVKDLTPWFVLVIVLDGNDEPAEVFLIHVDHQIVGSVLERLRALPADQADRLNKHYREVTWDSGEQLETHNGRALERALRFHIGEDPTAYAARKKSWIDTLGYGEDSSRVRVAFEASSREEANEMLTDLIVGLRTEIPASTIELTDVRFGIEKPAGNHDGVTFSVANRKPDGQAHLCFSKSDRSELVEIQCDVFASQLHIPQIEEEFHKVRFLAPFFSALMRSTKEAVAASVGDEKVIHKKFQINFGPVDLDKEHPIQHLYVAGRAALIVHHSTFEPIRVAIRTKGKTLLNSEIQVRGALDPDALHFWSVLAQFGKICTHFGLAMKAAVRVESVMDQTEAVEFMSATLDPSGPTASFRASSQLPSVPGGGRAAAVLFTSVCVVDTVVARCIAVIGQASWDDAGGGRLDLRVSDGLLRSMGEWTMPRSEWAIFDRPARAQDARKRLEGEGIAMVVTPSDTP